MNFRRGRLRVCAGGIALAMVVSTQAFADVAAGN
jgi:hypothetical protein